VITLPSRTRPELISSLGQRVAHIGRIPYLGALAYTGDPPPGPPGSGRAAARRPTRPRPAARQYNSAQRLRALWHELAVPGPLRDAVRRIGGPVLLVDDRVETGWTMTVAARLLRDAGAPAVLPLALAVTSS